MAKKGNPPRFSGVFNVNKPAGMTSHDVVSTVRRVGRERRIGHAGTLDPMATGVLLLCVGKGTRITEYLQSDTKRYSAVMHLGIETDTYDTEGEIVATHDIANISLADIHRAIETHLLGDIQQTPPMFSAVKRQGVPLYRLARQGIEVERQTRELTIARFEITSWHPPYLDADITCSKGTYIRSLAQDLGQLLGCGAHLCALERTASGHFDIQDAIALDELIAALEQDRYQPYLIPIDLALQHMPVQRFDAASISKLESGQTVSDQPPEPSSGMDQSYRAHDPGGAFVAIVRYDQANACWLPIKVFTSTP